MKVKVVKEFTLIEEIFNAIIHGIGFLLSVTGIILLIIKAVNYGSVVDIVSFSVFGFSACLLYIMSTLYHSFPNGKLKNVFERFDHISIYYLIWGTYSPFCISLIGGTTGWLLWIFLLILAITGTVFKAIWIDKWVVLHTLIYIAMGWAIIVVSKPLLSVIDMNGFLLLLIGGISYTFGTIFYVFRLFKFHHMIWHLFVLAGTILHFFAIYLYVI